MQRSGMPLEHLQVVVMVRMVTLRVMMVVTFRLFLLIVLMVVGMVIEKAER